MTVWLWLGVGTALAVVGLIGLMMAAGRSEDEADTAYDQLMEKKHGKDKRPDQR